MDSAALATYAFRLSNEDNSSHDELRNLLQRAMPELDHERVELLLEHLSDPQVVLRLRNRLSLGDLSNLLGGNRWGAPDSN